MNKTIKSTHRCILLEVPTIELRHACIVVPRYDDGGDHSADLMKDRVRPPRL